MTGSWQPIETAPKDGTSLLFYSREGIWQGKWNGDDLYNIFVPLFLDFHGCGGCCGGPPPLPTHWMPLPERPNAS